MKRLVIELDKNGEILNLFGDEIPEIIILDNRMEIPEDSPEWDHIDEILASVPYVVYQHPGEELPF